MIYAILKHLTFNKGSYIYVFHVSVYPPHHDEDDERSRVEWRASNNCWAPLRLSAAARLLSTIVVVVIIVTIVIIIGIVIAIVFINVYLKVILRTRYIHAFLSFGAKSDTEAVEPSTGLLDVQNGQWCKLP